MYKGRDCFFSKEIVLLNERWERGGYWIHKHWWPFRNFIVDLIQRFLILILFLLPLIWWPLDRSEVLLTPTSELHVVITPTPRWFFEFLAYSTRFSMVVLFEWALQGIHIRGVRLFNFVTFKEFVGLLNSTALGCLVKWSQDFPWQHSLRFLAPSDIQFTFSLLSLSLHLWKFDFHLHLIICLKNIQMTIETYCLFLCPKLLKFLKHFIDVVFAFDSVAFQVFIVMLMVVDWVSSFMIEFKSLSTTIVSHVYW